MGSEGKTTVCTGLRGSQVGREGWLRRRTSILNMATTLVASVGKDLDPAYPNLKIPGVPAGAVDIRPMWYGSTHNAQFNGGPLAAEQIQAIQDCTETFTLTVDLTDFQVLVGDGKPCYTANVFPLPILPLPVCPLTLTVKAESQQIALCGLDGNVVFFMAKTGAGKTLVVARLAATAANAGEVDHVFVFMDTDVMLNSVVEEIRRCCNFRVVWLDPTKGGQRKWLKSGTWVTDRTGGSTPMPVAHHLNVLRYDHFASSLYEKTREAISGVASTSMAVYDEVDKCYGETLRSRQCVLERPWETEIAKLRCTAQKSTSGASKVDIFYGAFVVDKLFDKLRVVDLSLEVLAMAKAIEE